MHRNSTVDLFHPPNFVIPAKAGIQTKSVQVVPLERIKNCSGVFIVPPRRRG